MKVASIDVAGERLLVLGGFVVVGWLTGGVAAVFPPDEWYASLHRPLITPPDWVFRVVWPALYVLSGAAAWAAWDRRRALHDAHGLWAAQLLLTAVWPWLFFGLHRMDLALGAIGLLLAVVAANAWAFWRIRPIAGALLLPYFAWLLFAALLNIAFVGLN